MGLGGTEDLGVLRVATLRLDQPLRLAVEALAFPDPLLELDPSLLRAGVSEAEADVARTNRSPNWSWEVSYGQRTGYPDMVSFGVSIPLPIAPAQRQDREIASKLALAEKAEAALTEAGRMATGDYRALAENAGRLAERIDRYRSSVVVPAEQRTAVALASYRSNQVQLMTVFEARHAEVETRRKLLSLQRDLAKTRAQLALKPVLQGATP